ncbi:tRNA (guanine37-N1)-methyltransferase [Thermosulfidibacter takaii ABI70S6]|uniref:tRNA (guanine-N(1)-)-methyltransferase n=1 Tax=Thermosulfidibacter takaii (strain DSM 17441 / JCM 13301 / NBRC 103674 / ABI70S6) TaxID=1298851 RepID=A0A0S3QS93_THET7|nr:tRNA (guanosine(37)-N1)-methyltransferase TrmD [Thermosulfidibacter takaii]BAT71200.1 tRNA (guanine37-N1)-methyltransferase [Thermosulfidibacter takaii ABI70S6]
MNFTLITIFPEIFDALKAGILGKALEKGIISITLINPRDFTHDVHRTVDDEPYGGGAGMVMKPEPLVEAIEKARKLQPETKVFILSPRGETFNQETAKKLAELPSITLLCGRYEGIDERVYHFADGAISIGDFVLSGGEFAALCIIDSLSRLIPGVLGCPGSLEDESFNEYLLEYPQYTRPHEFRGLKVPEILRSGNHALIEDWRRFQRIKETLFKRPDLLAKAPLTSKDKIKIQKLIKGEEWSQK